MACTSFSFRPFRLPSASSSRKMVPPVPEPMSVRNMSLEDYPLFKALALPTLYGPAPYKPSECICGRLGRGDGFCLCATSCQSDNRYSLFKANPEAYVAEQKELQHWFRIWKLWYSQVEQLETSNWIKSRSIVLKFERLKDAESPIGCDSCEKHGQTHCTCACENCSSKYCTGSCAEDGEYL